MDDTLIATSSISVNSAGTGTASVPKSVLDHLREPSEVAWFVDEETGLVYVVPEDEVTIR